MNNEKEKRNIPKEIQGLKNRKEFETYWEIHVKLDKIQTSIEELAKSDIAVKSELLHYIPVALVGTMESFLRSTLAKIINCNELYLNNAKGLFNGKLDLDIFRHLNKREFTIGEFLSHQFSFSKYEQINNHFTTIFGEDFFKQLCTYKVKTIFSGFRGPNPSDFEEKSKQIIIDLKEVFELRHIICHEMAMGLEIDEKRMMMLYKSVSAFIYQVYNYTYSILFPDSLLENDELYDKSKNRYEIANKELNEFIEKIKQNPKTAYEANLDVVRFMKSHEFWLEYANNYVRSLYFDFGNLHDTFCYEELAELMEDRLEDLKVEFERD